MRQPIRIMIVLMAGAAVLTACEQPHRLSQDQQVSFAQATRPENLMDMSTEVVNMNLTTQRHLDQLAQLVRQDPPTRADLNCPPAESLCKKAQALLAGRGVPVQSSGGSRGVTLVYERIVSRDCDEHNASKAPSSTVGCSVSANVVQMVGDKRQFISPALMDFPDSEQGVRAYEEHLRGR